MRLIQLSSILICFIFVPTLHAQEENTITKLESLIDSLEANTPEVEVIPSPKDIPKALPQTLLKENNRYLTFSLENDFLVFNGIDRDYTNGVRFTYFNIGQSQPKVVHFLNDILPAFDINKTTSTYYSVGQNLYTPHDITPSEHIENDRPYAAFAYGSIGLGTVHGNIRDDIELTMGVIGPSAQGELIQTEVHRFLNMDLPNGWDNQIHDEIGMMLSWERTHPRLYSAKIGDSVLASVTPHYGFTLGNVYTYGSAGIGIEVTPQSMPWQTPPVKVRPSIPSSGFFQTPSSGHSWQLFAGAEARAVLRNVFLDGNTFTDSHRIKKRMLVLDTSIGAAYSWDDLRVTYSYNWRSKEYYSPYSNTSQFGAVSFTYRF